MSALVLYMMTSFVDFVPLLGAKSIEYFSTIPFFFLLSFFLRLHAADRIKQYHHTSSKISYGRKEYIITFFLL